MSPVSAFCSHRLTTSTQHISTENYDRARRGLRRVQRFRRLGYPLQVLASGTVSVLRCVGAACFFLPSGGTRGVRSVQWTYATTYAAYRDPEPGKLRRGRALDCITPPGEPAPRGGGGSWRHGDVVLVEGRAVDGDGGSGSDEDGAAARRQDEAWKKDDGVRVHESACSEGGPRSETRMEVLSD